MSQFLKWASEMDRRQGAALEASVNAAEIERDAWKRAHAACSDRLGKALIERDSWQHMAKSRGQDLNRIRQMCTPAAQEPDIESTPDCVRRNLVALRKEADATKAKLAAMVAAASEFYEATYDGGIQAGMGPADIVLCSLLGEAIAAARVGAQ